MAEIIEITTGELGSRAYIYFDNQSNIQTFGNITDYFLLSGFGTTIVDYNSNFIIATGSQNSMTLGLTSATGSSVVFLKYNVQVSFFNANNQSLFFAIRKTSGFDGSQVVVPVPVATSPNSNATSTMTLTGIVSAQFGDSFDVIVKNAKNPPANINITSLSFSLFT